MNKLNNRPILTSAQRNTLINKLAAEQARQVRFDRKSLLDLLVRGHEGFENFEDEDLLERHEDEFQTSYQPDEGGQQADPVPGPEAATFALNFTRLDGFKLDASATLSGLTTLPNCEAISTAITESVTAWVASESEGASLWECSCHDLNIGDLLSHDAFESPALKSLLARAGVWVGSSAPAADLAEEYNYDTVLCSPDEAVEDEAA